MDEILGLNQREASEWRLRERGRFNPLNLKIPLLEWKNPRPVFVPGLFDEGNSMSEIAAAFGIMAACPHHDFLVRQDNPGRIREFLTDTWKWSACRGQEIARAWAYSMSIGKICDFAAWPGSRIWPLTNVFINNAACDRYLKSAGRVTLEKAIMENKPARRQPDTCIGCGCTNDRACPGGCFWVFLNSSSGHGLCSACALGTGPISSIAPESEAAKRRAVISAAGTADSSKPGGRRSRNPRPA